MNITDEEGQEACRRLNKLYVHKDVWSSPQDCHHPAVKALVTAMREEPWVPPEPPVDEATLCFEALRAQRPVDWTTRGIIAYALNWADERRKQDAD